jgi:pimeloyl-ACP methyl ester carboxylesterase
LVATLTQPGGSASSKHVVVGEGFGSLVGARYAALGPPGFKGLIIVSAGFGAKRSPISPVDDMRASEEAFKRLASKVTVPSLWIYARGNKRISESTANELFGVFKAGSLTAQLSMLPEIGMDGDALFSKGDPKSTWWEPVSKFLGSLDLR